jgi:hypothetical protein
MRRIVAVAAVLSLVLQAPAFAHEVDEYVQAALISLERDHLDVQLRLVAGAEVFARLFASIDINRDGAVSEAEKQTYAHAVVRDLAFTLNGQRAAAEIVSIAFPPVDLMKEGVGEIQLALRVPVSKSGPHQKLVIENHHQPAISAYLMNSLKPRDASLRIVTQRRSADQSRYELDYEVTT